MRACRANCLPEVSAGALSLSALRVGREQKAACLLLWPFSFTLSQSSVRVKRGEAKNRLLLLRLSGRHTGNLNLHRCTLFAVLNNLEHCPAARRGRTAVCGVGQSPIGI